MDLIADIGAGGSEREGAGAAGIQWKIYPDSIIHDQRLTPGSDNRH